MNGKFTIDFLYSQIKIMDKYEEALCNHSIPDKKTKEQCWEDFKAGQAAATQNYPDALRKILLLEHENRLWCTDMSTVCYQFDDKKRAIEAERKVANLRVVIAKQQLKIQRQAENITTLLQLYTSGKRSKSHKRLREKYKCLKKTYRVLQEQKCTKN